MTKYKDKWCQEAYNKGFKEGRDFEKGKLSTAKEIIEKLKALYLSPVVTKDDLKRQDKILAEAENFLKDSEVEK